MSSPGKHTPLLSLLEKLLLPVLAVIAFLYFSGKQQNTARHRLPVGSRPPVQYAPAQNRFSISGGTVAFDTAVDLLVTETIRSANHSVIGVTYTISRGQITKALNTASDSGISVDIAAQRIRNKEYLAFPLTELHSDDGIFHEKYLVIDENTVVLSSRNFNSFPSKNAVIVLDAAPDLARLLKQDHRTVRMRKKTDLCADGCPFSRGTLYTSPGHGCVAVKKTLKNARNTIRLAMYTLTSGTPMMRGMRDALRNDSQLIGIVDDWRGSVGKIVNKRSASYLKSLGAFISYDRMRMNNHPLLFHHKFAVIDETALVFGSMNWTKSGCYRNREYTVITKDPELVSIFSTYFDDIQKKISTETE